LKDLAKDTQKSIEEYGNALQDTVTEQLGTIKTSVKLSTDLINKTVQEASSKFENSINLTGQTLATATDGVSKQLTAATSSMQSMTANQEKTLVTTSEHFETTVNKTLADLSTKTQTSLNSYQQSLENLISEQSSTLSLAIRNAGNEFDRSIKDTATQFSGMASTIKQSVDIQEKTLTGISQSFERTIDKTLHDLAEQSKATIQNHERELHNIVNSQMNSINNSITNSSKEFNRLLTQNMNASTDVLKEQTKKLDNALQEELKIAIESLGRHLASLSRKFVDDYSPLTDKLREVVRLADDLKKGRIQ
jgi:hypothetical protein